MSIAGMVILGAGECGACAAFALRSNGYDGPVTLIGNESHLPYERPPLSKTTLVDGAGHKPVAPIEAYRDAKIDVRLGVMVDSISLEDSHLSLSDGNRISFEKLLLATGARPRRLPGSEFAHGRVKYLRTFGDAVDIRSSIGAGRRLAIIGAGFIGLELAATARTRGCDVTVIEAQSRVLQRGVPEAIAAVISARHLHEGVVLSCGVGISSLIETETGVEISLADGTEFTVDTVVVGIGAMPNIALAEAAGIEVDNGIAVDETLRTSASNVFAAGDCCSFPLPIYGGRRVRLEAWRNARDQGALAARNMLGANEAISSIPYFWSDQYDLTLQVAGLADGAATTVRRDVDGDAFLLFHLNADGVLVAVSGIGGGLTIARDIKLAERLIASKVVPDPVALASPDVRLKTLLAG